MPVNVEAPWRLDPAIPVRFVPAHKDHANFLNTVQDQTDHGFCVPLWAEGYGGTQMFGATVDAGMVGVISGTVEFGVVKTETAIGKVPVSAGPIAVAASMTIPLPTHDKYELALKLRDGKEQVFSESGSMDKVSIDWAADKVELRSGTKPQ